VLTQPAPPPSATTPQHATPQHSAAGPARLTRAGAHPMSTAPGRPASELLRRARSGVAARGHRATDRIPHRLNPTTRSRPIAGAGRTRRNSPTGRRCASRSPDARRWTPGRRSPCARSSISRPLNRNDQMPPGPPHPLVAPPPTQRERTDLRTALNAPPSDRVLLDLRGLRQPPGCDRRWPGVDGPCCL
jgi:hypothetical protein